MLNDLYQILDPVAFEIGPITVRWYGLAYLVGFIGAFFVMWKLAKRWKLRIDEDALLTVMLAIILGTIVGGRLGYVIIYGDWEYWAAYPLDILAFSNGGMSFHGGLIGVLIGALIASKVTGIPFLTLADMGSVGAAIGLFFGRCANFINGELWGSPTDLPWGVVFGGAAGDVARHPSQLYEAVLEGLVIFAVLFILSRKLPPRPRGTFFGLFLVMYGVFRFAVEFIREPDYQIGYLWGDWLTMGQLLSLPLIVVGAGLLVYAVAVKHPQEGIPQMLQK